MSQTKNMNEESVRVIMQQFEVSISDSDLFSNFRYNNRLTHRAINIRPELAVSYKGNERTVFKNCKVK